MSFIQVFVIINEDQLLISDQEIEFFARFFAHDFRPEQKLNLFVTNEGVRPAAWGKIWSLPHVESLETLGA